jgi:hypothetical protein
VAAEVGLVIARIAAMAAWVGTLLMGIATLWGLFATNFLLQVSGGAMDDAMITLTVIAVVGVVGVTMAYATVGLVLVGRPRGSRIAVVLLAGGVCFAAIPMGYIVGGTLVMRDPLDPLANVIFLLGPAMIAPGYTLILPGLALLFPTGSLPSGLWRAPALVALAMLTTTTAITILRPGEIADTASRNPFGIEAMPDWMAALPDALAGLGVILASIMGVAAVIVRYRRGSGVERHQLRWFVAAVLLAAVPIAVSPQPGIGGPQWLLLAEFGLFLVPVSVGIAVTRYRLYEIDRLISRGLSWAILSGLLVAVYAAGVLLLQGLLAGATQGQTLAVAASTLLAAALFQPLRLRLQRAMDRRFDRARYDGEQTAQGFAERLRDQVDLRGLEADMTGTVREALHPSSAGLWVRGDRVP